MGIVERITKVSPVAISRLEKELNFGNGTIKRWDTNSPSVDKIILLANYLNVSIDYLCTGKISDIGFVGLTKQQTNLLIFIKKSGCAAISTIDKPLLGENSFESGEFSTLKYLLSIDFIEFIPDVDVPKEKYVKNDSHYKITEKGLAYYENCLQNNNGIIGILGDKNENNTVNINGVENKLSDIESEIIKVCANLDMRHKNALLTYAYELESKINK